MPRLQRLRDIVVILPGIMGSVLHLEGQRIWPPSLRARDRLHGGLGSPLKILRPTSHGGNGVVATRLAPQITIIPGLVKFAGYEPLTEAIASRFALIQGESGSNFLEFPYDWRLDNRVIAERLGKFIERRLSEWRKFANAPDAKVIFIAHSMGGLVARYYLEILGGWRNCRALITFGTPYRGSVKALGYLAQGRTGPRSLLIPTARTMPSIYQLLPVYPVLHANGGTHRVAEGPEIAGIDSGLAADALAFHREIESAVAINTTDENYLRVRYALLPFVGTHQRTWQSAILGDGGIRLQRHLPAGVEPWLDARGEHDGDGTVPMVSAVPLELSNELWDTFRSERHSSLQVNPGIVTDVIARLVKSQFHGLGAIRGPEPTRFGETSASISVDVEDSYPAGSTIRIMAETDGAAPDWQLLARIACGQDREPATVHRFVSRGDAWELELPPMARGVYRLTVSTDYEGPGAPSAVHDVFEVSGDLWPG